MSSDDSVDMVMYANLSIARIARARRQITRLMETYAALVEAVNDAGPISGPIPEALEGHFKAFEDEQYFMILATNHALNAAFLLRNHGVPGVRQATALRAWRNTEEHWSDPAHGKDIRALDTWQKHSDESEPGLSHSGVGTTLRYISGVRLDELVQDLEELQTATERARDAEWDKKFLTPHQAADLLGITTEQFEGPSGPTLARWNFDGELGVRYERSEVERHLED